jgi:hypothetical protein
MPALRVATVAVAVLVLSGAAAPVSGIADQGAVSPPAKQDAKAPKPKQPPSAKLAEPWPDADGLAKRRSEAEGRRLFQSLDPLEVTITADFKAVNGDRNPDSKKTFPGTVTVAGDNGTPTVLKVTLATRGNLRLNVRTCANVPLKVNFVKKETSGTVFDGQDKMKLVVHCQDGDRYEQFVLREYLAYRLHNLLSPHAFRVRLARATYVDARNGKVIDTKPAVFIEDDGDVAKRMDGRVVELPRMSFKDFDQQALVDMALFQYMIGNTDYSIYALHNLVPVTTPAKVFYPIIWDFDVSGLVSPPYGIPAKSLGIYSVKERLYRGPCRTMDEYEPSLAKFRSKEAEALELVNTIPGLQDRDKKDVTEFLRDFFTRLNRKDGLKKDLVDNCKSQPTM